VSAVLERIAVKRLGRTEYAAALKAMKVFTGGRTDATPDELWLTEHPPVYTLGQGAAEVVVSNGIALVRSDRGGQITYHGPGQIVLYALVDLGRRGIKVKQFVSILEQAVIDLLDQGERRPGAPGVYVGGAKIAALGIRVTRGRSYHGLALNVDMDLSPYSAIDSCGFPGLRVTQTTDLGIGKTRAELEASLARNLISRIENA